MLKNNNKIKCMYFEQNDGTTFKKLVLQSNQAN